MPKRIRQRSGQDIKEKSMIKLIACADIHLRDSVPLSRIDDYWKAQEKKFEFLINTAVQHNCDIYCAGDLFHKAKSSSYLEAWAINKLKRLKGTDSNFIVIPGQHDIPNHNIDMIKHSSIWVLQQAEVINLCTTYYGKPFVFEDQHIMMIHDMIHKDKPIHPDIKSAKAINLLKKYPDVKLIISGDNHQPFVETSKQNWYLINCGSMMRMTADQINYKPKFYYVVINNYSVIIKEIPYLIEKDVMNIDHIDKQKERDSRIETFVNRINDDYEIELSFEKNLEKFLNKNKVRKGVQEKCWEAVNE